MLIVVSLSSAVVTVVVVVASVVVITDNEWSTAEKGNRTSHNEHSVANW